MINATDRWSVDFLVRNDGVDILEGRYKRGSYTMGVGVPEVG